MQVTREVPTVVQMNNVNTAVQQLVAARSGEASVFQYCKLVNVPWNGAPTPPAQEPGANAAIRLKYGTFDSQGGQPVSNTIMESFTPKNRWRLECGYRFIQYLPPQRKNCER